MSKQGMARPDWTHTKPRNEAPPVPEIQGKAKHGKKNAKTFNNFSIVEHISFHLVFRYLIPIIFSISQEISFVNASADALSEATAVI